MTYVRRIIRSWTTKDGNTKKTEYYYYYKSRRIGDKVISECVGKATKADWDRLHKEKEVIVEEIGDTRPKIKRV